MKKKNLSKNNQLKSANEVEKFTTLVDVRNNFEFRRPYQIWPKNSRIQHFALQIAFFNSCTPFRTKVMPIQNFLWKKGYPLIFALSAYHIKE